MTCIVLPSFILVSYQKEKNNCVFDILCIALVIIEKEGEGNSVEEISIYAGNAATRPWKVWLMRDLFLDFLPWEI